MNGQFRAMLCGICDIFLPVFFCLMSVTWMADSPGVMLSISIFFLISFRFLCFLLSGRDSLSKGSSEVAGKTKNLEKKKKGLMSLSRPVEQH